jgi:hypothetical protein
LLSSASAATARTVRTSSSVAPMWAPVPTTNTVGRPSAARDSRPRASCDERACRGAEGGIGPRPAGDQGGRRERRARKDRRDAFKSRYATACCGLSLSACQQILPMPRTHAGLRWRHLRPGSQGAGQLVRLAGGEGSGAAARNASGELGDRVALAERRGSLPHEPPS